MAPWSKIFAPAVAGIAVGSPATASSFLDGVSAPPLAFKAPVAVAIGLALTAPSGFFASVGFGAAALAFASLCTILQARSRPILALLCLCFLVLSRYYLCIALWSREAFARCLEAHLVWQLLFDSRLCYESLDNCWCKSSFLLFQSSSFQCKMISLFDVLLYASYLVGRGHRHSLSLSLILDLS
jgi:hypothetical protein